MSERYRIKSGWQGEGREGLLLHVATDEELGQQWAMILWDGDEDPDCFKMAGLEIIKPTYRTKELDYDARHKPKTTRSCVRCQKDIKPESPARMVHLVNGGNFILHPNDEEAYRKQQNQSGDMGWWLIGMDCAKVEGMEWSHPQ